MWPRLFRFLGALCAILTALFPTLLAAQFQVSEISGVQKLDAESLIELAHASPELIVIDSRVSEDRKFGYIEDSISLPDEQTSCQTLNNITSDKTRLLAFYCNGIKCGRSVKAIKIAQKCEYKNLYWFRGGFQEWRLKDYPYLME
jgi:rhodanese-related sulfurtransferase